MRKRRYQHGQTRKPRKLKDVRHVPPAPEAAASVESIWRKTIVSAFHPLATFRGSTMREPIDLAPLEGDPLCIASVNDEVLAGNPARGFAQQEDDRIGYFFGRS